jgi:hypothetical protein
MYIVLIRLASLFVSSRTQCDVLRMAREEWFGDLVIFCHPTSILPPKTVNAPSRHSDFTGRIAKHNLNTRVVGKDRR